MSKFKTANSSERSELCNKKEKNQNRSVLYKQQILKKQLEELFLENSIEDSDSYSCRNLVALVCKRKEEERIPEIFEKFRIENKSEFASVKDFYFWYQSNRLGVSDIEVYNVCSAVFEELDLPKPKPSVFSGLGSNLISRLSEWRGDGGNTMEDLLILYFSEITPHAVKFNPGIAHNPKSLLGNYGWSLFEEHVSKHDHLLLSEEEVRRIQKERELLVLVQKHRNVALQNGDLELYDKLGMTLTEEGVDAAYSLVRGKLLEGVDKNGRRRVWFDPEEIAAENQKNNGEYPKTEEEEKEFWAKKDHFYKNIFPKMQREFMDKVDEERKKKKKRETIVTRSFVTENEEGKKVRSWAIVSDKFSVISCTDAATNFDAAKEALKYYFYECGKQEKPVVVFVGHEELAGVLVRGNSKNKHRNWEEIEEFTQGFEVEWKSCENEKTMENKTLYDKAGILSSLAVKNNITEPLRSDGGQ